MTVYRILNAEGKAWKGGYNPASWSHCWTHKAGKVYANKKVAENTVAKITRDGHSPSGIQVVAFTLTRKENDPN